MPEPKKPRRDLVKAKATPTSGARRKAAPAADASPCSFMMFEVRRDQRSNIEMALEEAKRDVPTQSEAVALEAIALNYQESAHWFLDWHGALASYRMNVKEPSEFFSNVLTFAERLYPGVLVEYRLHGVDHNQGEPG